MSIPMKMNPMGCSGPYTKLNYLESTGEQWIDTGVIPNVNMRVVAKVQVIIPYIESDVIPVGVTENRGQVNGRFYVIAANSESIQYQFRSVINASTLIYYIDPGFNIIDFNNNSYVYLNSSNIGKLTLSSFDWTRNIYMFAYNSAGDAYCTACRISYTNFYADGSVLSNSLIPVLCKAGQSYIDGNTNQRVTATADKPGMYDTISKKLFVNQGTGADFLYA